jgi:hypothetical protein
MRKQSSIVGGLILIAIGLLFLALQAFPDFAGQFDLTLYWPFLLVGIGGLFLLGAVGGSPPLAVPGTIVGGIGLLLVYQNATGNWASWSYAWTLIPGFVGLGLLLSSLLDRQKNVLPVAGVRLMIISLVLFLIFGGFFGALGAFWPVLLIVVGGVLLLHGRTRALSKANDPLNKSS